MPLTLAYKCVAVAAMLAEINFCADRLHLPVKLPIEKKDIQREMVFLPRNHVFAGRIDADGYVFSFAKTGRLRFIVNLKYERGDKPLRPYLEELANVPTTIDTKGALRLATSWLSALDVDLDRLEREHPSSVRQASFRSWAEDGKPSRDVSLPIFDVKWGDWDKPAVDVQVSGSTGELIKLRQEDVSYSRRPEVLIKNADELLAIRDEDYAKYSALDQSNLVMHFESVQYPNQGDTQ
jgi:hypothetical protein